MKKNIFKVAFGIFFITTTLQGCTEMVSLPTLNSSSNSTSEVAQANSINTIEQSISYQINEYRQSRNLTYIILDSFLSEQARLYSQQVASGQASFENSNFDTQFDYIQEEIPFQSVKVNLAYNKGYNDPATATVESWLESTSHRQNFEGDFDLMGIGVAKNEDNEYFFTHILLKEIPSISSETLRQMELEVFHGVNKYRRSRGLSTLKFDPRISQQARAHSNAMAIGSADFSHDGFDQRVNMIGNSINYLSAAENLAYNQGHDDPVGVAIDGWINSPGHHKNMIGDFTLTGIGVIRNEKGEYYMNQMFVKD